MILFSFYISIIMFTLIFPLRFNLVLYYFILLVNILYYFILYYFKGDEIEALKRENQHNY